MSENKLWGGRFLGATAPEMAALSQSVQFDWRLANADLFQSRAHAGVLRDANLLNHADYESIVGAIDKLIDQIRSGQFLPNASDEDVHSAIERGLVELLGAELGGRLRAGRSRNDQVATDFRIYMRESATALRIELVKLTLVFIEIAEANVEVVAPGFTHLQHAQPVSFGHELAKHAHALLRDIDRLDAWLIRHNYSPLGAGALAGSSLALDPERVAAELGFAGALGNSIDAVSARDFVSEFLFVCAQIGINLSRIGEEVVLWSTMEFGWAKLSDAFSTGSSIMPQKKNPDVAELARGKAGRLIGDLTGFLATCKSLPFAYNRDLQEDKEATFDAIDTLMLLLPAVTGMMATLQFNTERIQNSAALGFALATDIAEWLVRAGVPFKQAHEISGKCVAVAESRGVELWDLSDVDFAEISTHLTSEVRTVLSAAGSVAARNRFGGTAPERVREQLRALRKQVQA